MKNRKYQQLIPFPHKTFSVKNDDVYKFLKNLINIWASYKGINLDLEKGFFFFPSEKEAEIFEKILKKCGIKLDKEKDLYDEKDSKYECDRYTMSPYPFNKKRNNCEDF